MIFQFLTIDMNQLLDFGSASPMVLAWRFLVYGGWIPLVIVCLWGFKEAWLNWRVDLNAARAKHVLLAVDVPRENEQLPKAVENIFTHIHGACVAIDFFEKWWKGKHQPTFSFEICSHGGYVQFYVNTETRFRDLVESAIFSQYPDAEINEVEDYAKQFAGVTFPPKDENAMDLFGAEYRLKKDEYLPIRTYEEFEEKLAGEFKDPLGTMLESFSKIKPEEQVWIQIIAKPADSEWKNAGSKFIKAQAGIKETPKRHPLAGVVDAPMKLFSDALVYGSVITPGEAVKKKDDTAMFRMLLMTPDNKAVMEGVANKINKQGFDVKLRFVYLAPKRMKFIPGIFPAIKGSLNQFNALGSNGFSPFIPVMTQDDYFWLRWTLNGKKRRILKRYISRSGDGCPPRVLNVEEMATIWHFPIITTKAPLVKKTESRRGEPPAGLPFEQAAGPGAGAWSKPPKARKPAPPVAPPPSAPPTNESGNIPFV
jgi:hypothetical protein